MKQKREAIQRRLDQAGIEAPTVWDPSEFQLPPAHATGYGGGLRRAVLYLLLAAIGWGILQFMAG